MDGQEDCHTFNVAYLFPVVAEEKLFDFEERSSRKQGIRAGLMASADTRHLEQVGYLKMLFVLQGRSLTALWGSTQTSKHRYLLKPAFQDRRWTGLFDEHFNVDTFRKEGTIVAEEFLFLYWQLAVHYGLDQIAKVEAAMEGEPSDLRLDD